MNLQLFLLLLTLKPELLKQQTCPLQSVVTPQVSHQLKHKVLIDEAAVHSCNVPPLRTAAPELRDFMGITAACRGIPFQ